MKRNKKEEKRFKERVRCMEVRKECEERDKKIETTGLVMRTISGVATAAERVKLRGILREAKKSLKQKQQQAQGE